MNPAHGRDAGGDAPTLITFLNVLLRHRRLTIGLPLVTFVLVVGATLLLAERKYTAHSKFTLQGSETPNRLAGLAAQFGVNIGDNSSSESPGFYAELLRTRELLREAALTEYRVQTPDGVRNATAVELLTDAGPQEKRVRDTVEKLEEWVAANADQRTGIVSVRTQVPGYPDLAVLLNRRLLELVNEFNLEKRQSRASAERAFVESRLAEARQELADAENSLNAYLSRNRRGEAPHIQLEISRRERQVGLRQEVYTSLVQAFEEARINEVRNTPVITVVDSPEGSVRPAGRGLMTNGVLALLIGFLAGAGLAFLREYFLRQRLENPGEYGEFVRLGRPIRLAKLTERAP